MCISFHTHIYSYIIMRRYGQIYLSVCLSIYSSLSLFLSSFLFVCLFLNSSLLPLFSFSLCSPTSGDLEDGGYKSKHGD